MKQQVSGPVAAVVILVVLVVFGLLFSNARLAPPEKVEPGPPPEPPREEQEVEMARRGLKPLGIVAVLPPLMEDRRLGVRVAAVAPNSPAARAGIKVGDRIEQFGDSAVVHPMALARALGQVRSDQSTPVVILRGGKKETLTVTGLQALPPEERPGP